MIDIFVFDFIPHWYSTQEMCDRVVSEDPFLIAYFPHKYKTQRMCDETVMTLQEHWNLFPIGFLHIKWDWNGYS